MAIPPTVQWTGRFLRLLDQTKLPGRTAFLAIRDEEQLWAAIRRLSVRGAPAIGVAAAYGVVLGARGRKPTSIAALRRAVEESAGYLATSRPTAVNLFWALDAMRAVARGLDESASVREGLSALLAEAQRIQADDEARCAAIARHGAPLLEGLAGVSTHCNAGALATAGVGTALGVIIEAAKRNKGMVVFVDETRPLLQGSRLTAWELAQAGVPYRLMADSMAATAMQRGLVQAVVTGADRIAANGDSANKIGTMPLAICARHFGVPFHIAAPLSTVDFDLPDGSGIPIEERDGDEIAAVGAKRMAPGGAEAFNPAFDVVPAKLIASIITEAGVLRPPFKSALARARRMAGA